jgi:hypothetical protein
LTTDIGLKTLCKRHGVPIDLTCVACDLTLVMFGVSLGFQWFLAWGLVHCVYLARVSRVRKHSPPALPLPAAARRRSGGRSPKCLPAGRHRRSRLVRRLSFGALRCKFGARVKYSIAIAQSSPAACSAAITFFARATATQVANHCHEVSPLGCVPQLPHDASPSQELASVRGHGPSSP